MKVDKDIWQVLTQGEVYQADLPTLKQWVVDGIVQPSDKVRKGNLKWIEAQRAPMLRRVFTGEEQPPFESQSDSESHSSSAASHAQSALEGGSHDSASPFASNANLEGVATAGAGEVSRAYAQTPSHAFSQTSPNASSQYSSQAAWSGAQTFDAHSHGGQTWNEPAWNTRPGLDSACRFHPVEAATLVCRGCHATFCRACPNQVSASSVYLCPVCGNFCDPLEGLKERVSLYDFQSEGFGFSDFGTALLYPFKHLASLLGGALLYAFLLLAGMRAQFLASALLFGCISLVIHRVGNGKLHRDFLPDFADFSFWDDVLVPCFLGLGVTIATLGPIIVLFIALLFGWFGGAQANPFAPTSPLLAEQQQKVVGRDDMGALVNGGTAAEEEELAKKVEAMRPGSRIARAAQSSKENEDPAFTVIRQLMAHAGLILLLALLAIGWAVFYHPMALLVAGWTESFKSTINPLVGLDTMRHMGLNYVKAFVMYLVVQVFAFVAGFFVSIATAPFDMPFIGNLPGKFLGGIVTFYTSLVIACVLGLSLFKSADRLGIEIE